MAFAYRVDTHKQDFSLALSQALSMMQQVDIALTTTHQDFEGVHAILSLWISNVVFRWNPQYLGQHAWDIPGTGCLGPVSAGL